MVSSEYLSKSETDIQTDGVTEMARSREARASKKVGEKQDVNPIAIPWGTMCFFLKFLN